MTPIDIAIVIVRAVLIAVILLSLVPLLVWLERKGSAYIQDRPGPERAAIGPIRAAGLVHLLADAAKFIFRGEMVPAGANKFYFYLAPIIVTAIAFTTAAILPWFDDIHLPNGVVIGGQALNIDAGILWFFAIAGLTVYGVIFAGWSSNSKFSLLGSMRASAAVLSYEIPMGLSVIGAIMYYGTVSLPSIVQQQAGVWFGFLPKWGVFVQPLGALIFIVASFAETNRTPFDLAESESELVAGYHTEYGSMKFAMFMLGEYVAMVVSSGIAISLYFGGWQVPWLDTAALTQHAQILTQWSLGVAFALSLVLTALFLSNFQAQLGRWKDWRDYESLIFALLVLGGGATALLLMFVLMAVQLPTWYGPVFAGLAQFGIFMAKVLFACWVFVWVRWTLPRFRYDQVMNLGWRSLLPLALVNILLTGLVITVLK